MNPEIVKVFQTPDMGNRIRNELIHKFQKYGIRGFEILHYKRYEDKLIDDFPVAFKIHLPYHPHINYFNIVSKEEIFDCFRGTILENKWLMIIPEIVF